MDIDILLNNIKLNFMLFWFIYMCNIIFLTAMWQLFLMFN